MFLPKVYFVAGQRLDLAVSECTRIVFIMISVPLWCLNGPEMSSAEMTCSLKIFV